MLMSIGSWGPMPRTPRGTISLRAPSRMRTRWSRWRAPSAPSRTVRLPRRSLPLASPQKVAMIAMRDLRLDHARVNVNGGACALGHPIGASGARILVTLLHALKRRNLKHGVAALCIGGGEATAVAIELL